MAIAIIAFLIVIFRQRKQTLHTATEKPPLDDGVDRTPALAVSLAEPWWLAVHQILNDAELETIKGARRVHTGANSNATIAAVGASEGVDLVRQKLNEAREYALKLTRK